jgi:hypothetical protein
MLSGKLGSPEVFLPRGLLMAKASLKLLSSGEHQWLTRSIFVCDSALETFHFKKF